MHSRPSKSQALDPPSGLYGKAWQWGLTPPTSDYRTVFFYHAEILLWRAHSLPTQHSDQKIQHFLHLEYLHLTNPGRSPEMPALAGWRGRACLATYTWIQAEISPQKNVFLSAFQCLRCQGTLAECQKHFRPCPTQPWLPGGGSGLGDCRGRHLLRGGGREKINFSMLTPFGDR